MVVAHEVSSSIEYGGYSIEEASKIALSKVEKSGGKGRLIAINAKEDISYEI